MFYYHQGAVAICPNLISFRKRLKSKIAYFALLQNRNCVNNTTFDLCYKC